jgi:hypothetical protein
VEETWKEGGTFVTELGGVGRSAYDGEIWRGEEGACSCFCCHGVCFVLCMAWGLIEVLSRISMGWGSELRAPKKLSQLQIAEAITKLWL